MLDKRCSTAQVHPDGEGAGENGLSRRRVLRGGLALAATGVFGGCASGLVASDSSKSVVGNDAVNPQPAPSGQVVAGTLSVTATSVGNLPARFLGFSAEKTAMPLGLFSGTNANLIALYNLLGPQVLRIGGGSVDANDWTPTGTGKTTGQVAPSDVDRLNAFLSATGYQCIYGTNFAGANSTTATAAAESAYVYDSLGAALSAMEIGNEPDSYGNTSSYFPGNWSLAQFESRWSQYRAAMVSARPLLPLCGAACASNASTWTVPFANYATSSQINLLSQHYYRYTSSSGTPTTGGLVNPQPDPVLTSLLSTVKGGANSIGVPFRVAECNSVSAGGLAGVSNVYAATLWAIDYLFDCALDGAAGVNFHGTGASTGYAPIATSNGVVTSVQPLFYGMHFFSKVGAGTLYSTTFSGNSYTTAYAVKTATTLKIVLVNKDSTHSINLAINLYKTVRAATLTQLTQLSSGATAPSLSGTDGITLQGSAIGVDGTYSPAAAYTLSPGTSQLSCYVPALSAVIIEVT